MATIHAHRPEIAMTRLAYYVAKSDTKLPEYAVWSACEYWKTRGLNDAANHADSDILKKKYRGNVIDVSPVEFISITINGGYNGMDDRKQAYAMAQRVLLAPPLAAPTTGALLPAPDASSNKQNVQ